MKGEIVEFQATINVPHITREQADRLWDAIDSAVCEVTGRVANGSHVVVPDYNGPGRSAEEAERAAAEGRR